MADPFASPGQMLFRGRHHIDDLKAQIYAFMKEKPWTDVTEENRDGITKTWKIRFTKQISEHFPNIIFDAANNLRATLDQLAFAVGIRHTRRCDPKSAKFPFGPTKVKKLNNMAGGCKDLPAEIQSIFAAFKPHKGENNLLWAMNELCNAPKHKMLYPVAIGSGKNTISTASLLIHGPGAIKQPIWDSEKNEVKFANIGPGHYFGGHLNTSFKMVFDKVDEVIRNQEPVRVLNAMAGEVEHILMATEAECRRIGLIRVPACPLA